MYSAFLKQELKLLATEYGNTHYGAPHLHSGVSSKDSVIFSDLNYNFHKKLPTSFFTTGKHVVRLQKFHTTFNPALGIREMQSSNSSDALLMNIFCFPGMEKWGGLKKLLGIDSFSKIEFGHKPEVEINVGGKVLGDTTEVDVLINDIFCESKLTEGDFTRKEKSKVDNYVMFHEVFHTNYLVQDKTHYYNYQLIRNILAAEQYGYRFVLFCDMRRPDLTKSFYQTVRCIKDKYIDLRNRCEIIYWQDIAAVCGRDLQEFLKEKYGINQ